MKSQRRCLCAVLMVIFCVSESQGVTELSKEYEDARDLKVIKLDSKTGDSKNGRSRRTSENGIKLTDAYADSLSRTELRGSSAESLTPGDKFYRTRTFSSAYNLNEQRVREREQERERHREQLRGQESNRVSHRNERNMRDRNSYENKHGGNDLVRISSPLSTSQPIVSSTDPLPTAQISNSPTDVQGRSRGQSSFPVISTSPFFSQANKQVNSIDSHSKESKSFSTQLPLSSCPSCYVVDPPSYASGHSHYNALDYDRYRYPGPDRYRNTNYGTRVLYSYKSKKIPYAGDYHYHDYYNRSPPPVIGHPLYPPHHSAKPAPYPGIRPYSNEIIGDTPGSGVDDYRFYDTASLPWSHSRKDYHLHKHSSYPPHNSVDGHHHHDHRHRDYEIGNHLPEEEITLFFPVSSEGEYGYSSPGLEDPYYHQHGKRDYHHGHHKGLSFHREGYKSKYIPHKDRGLNLGDGVVTPGRDNVKFECQFPSSVNIVSNIVWKRLDRPNPDWYKDRYKVVSDHHTGYASLTIYQPSRYDNGYYRCEASTDTKGKSYHPARKVYLEISYHGGRDLGGEYGPDVGGYRPDVGGYRPDVGGYRPDVGGYRPDVGGYDGYGPDLSGYDPYIGGHGPHASGHRLYPSGHGPDTEYPYDVRPYHEEHGYRKKRSKGTKV